MTQDKDNSFLQVEATSEEKKQLLDLLAEYAEKLSVRSESLYRLRFRILLQLVLIVAAATGLLLIFLFISVIPEPKLMEAKTEILFIVTGFLVVITGTLPFLKTSYLRRRAETDRILHLQHVVQKLVRRCSQLEDHGSLGFTSVIAFDLRLAEAESALRQSWGLTGHSKDIKIE